MLFGVLQGWEWWLNRRAQRDWDRGEAERQRRWAEEEQMSDEQREWQRQYREREAAIQREARRRLGLPEEET